MKKICFLLSMILPALMAGCASTRLTVANATDSPVSDVYLRSEGITYFSAGSIPPHAAGPCTSLKQPLPPVVMLTWKTPEGNMATQKVRREKALPKKFSGRFIYQINRDGSAKLFVMADENKGRSLIPWGFSEKFDGTVNMPGFTEQP